MNNQATSPQQSQQQQQYGNAAQQQQQLYSGSQQQAQPGQLKSEQQQPQPGSQPAASNFSHHQSPNFNSSMAQGGCASLHTPYFIPHFILLCHSLISLSTLYLSHHPIHPASLSIPTILLSFPLHSSIHLSIHLSIYPFIHLLLISSPPRRLTLPSHPTH